MSVSSLGRTATLPSFREPVAPLGASELGGVGQTKGSFTVTELPTHRAAVSVTSGSPLEPFARVGLSRAVDNVDEVQQFQDLMRRNTVELVEARQPDLASIPAKEANFDPQAFVQGLSPESLQQHFAEAKDDFRREVTSNDVSFDESTPISRSTVLIRERLNEAEIIRRLPSTVANNRLTEMVSFQDGGTVGSFAAVA